MHVVKIRQNCTIKNNGVDPKMVWILRLKLSEVLLRHVFNFVNHKKFEWSLKIITRSLV